MSIPYFTLVQYGKHAYPEGMQPGIVEVPAHFDAKPVQKESGEYSLHTEYAAGTRKFASPLHSGLPTLAQSTRDGVPRLWDGKAWAEEFAEYLFRFVAASPGLNTSPRLVEIHPPFTATCAILEDFVATYLHFQHTILTTWPETTIVIENRCGTRFASDKFLLSKTDHLLELSQIIDTTGIPLRLCADIPQLFTAHLGRRPFTCERIDAVLMPLVECRHNILSVHIWGKKRSKSGTMQPHFGDLNTYFEDDALKQHFLTTFRTVFADGKARYLVPEVNGKTEDLRSILEEF